MVNPNPNLGISAGFDADQFRNAIRFAMEMGTPPDAAKRAKFIRKNSSERTYTKNGNPVTNPRLDRDGNPLDPMIVMTVGEDETIEVDCAVEVDRADADELPVGNFRPIKAVVTLLDEEYAQVRGCQELIFNERRFRFSYEPEGLGLFEVGVNTMIFYALGGDE